MTHTRLQAVNGPLTNDTITYSYDELGRVLRRDINSVALTYEYDVLGRVITESNLLGTFSYQYEGVTSRLRTVTYPNGQTANYAYFPNSGDHRLQEIHNQKVGGTTVSKFNYLYDELGRIKTWTQQQDTNPSKAYDFDYDSADQLRTAVWRTTDATPAVLKRFSYVYDPSGNRTVEQIDNSPLLTGYDNMNRLTSQTPGGTVRFAGTLNEAATVAIQSQPAIVSGDNAFEGRASVSVGTNQVIVKAKDYAGNERTNTYEISVSGSSKTFTSDSNGNSSGDGTRTLEWNAEDRLIAVNAGTSRSEFVYDGLGRRVRIVEKVNGVVTLDRRFLWCFFQLCQERDSSGTSVTERYHRLGKTEGSSPYFYTFDHLGSIRELTDSSETVRARYAYDPYGRRTFVSGDKSAAFGFTGHYEHSETGLTLSLYRVFDSQLGRWISEDPNGLAGGEMNLYSYAGQDPLNYYDPTGGIAIVVALPAAAKGLAALGALVASALLGWELGQRYEPPVDIFPPSEPPPFPPPRPPRNEPPPPQPPTPTPPSGVPRPPVTIDPVPPVPPVECGPTELDKCKKACRGDDATREAYCRTLDDPQVRARCWSKVYESLQNCLNWCSFEFGN